MITFEPRLVGGEGLAQGLRHVGDAVGVDVAQPFHARAAQRVLYPAVSAHRALLLRQFRGFVLGEDSSSCVPVAEV